MSGRATERVVKALRAHDCNPQPLFDNQDEWWIADSPCRGNRSLIVGPNGQISGFCES